MAAAQERDYAMRLAFLHVFVDVQQRVGDELHPQLFDLMHRLELQLVAVAELIERFLTTQQRVRVEIDLVVERAAALHLAVKIFAVHDARSSRVSRAPLFLPSVASRPAQERTVFGYAGRENNVRQKLTRP